MTLTECKYLSKRTKVHRFNGVEEIKLYLGNLSVMTWNQKHRRCGIEKAVRKEELNEVTRIHMHHN